MDFFFFFVTGLVCNQLLEPQHVPVKMGGLSHCFRMETTHGGEMNRGLYRVHQFSKAEMFVVCAPEQSEDMMEELRLVEQEIFSEATSISGALAELWAPPGSAAPPPCGRQGVPDR